MNDLKTLEKVKEFVIKQDKLNAQSQLCSIAKGNKDDSIYYSGKAVAFTTVLLHLNGLIAEQEDLER